MSNDQTSYHKRPDKEKHFLYIIGLLPKGDVVGVSSVTVSGVHGAGAFVVFGDDAVFQNRYLDANNRKLATNVGNWLVGRQ